MADLEVPKQEHPDESRFWVPLSASQTDRLRILVAQERYPSIAAVVREAVARFLQDKEGVADISGKVAATSNHLNEKLAADPTHRFNEGRSRDS